MRKKVMDFPVKCFILKTQLEKTTTLRHTFYCIHLIMFMFYFRKYCMSVYCSVSYCVFIEHKLADQPHIFVIGSHGLIYYIHQSEISSSKTLL